MRWQRSVHMWRRSRSCRTLLADLESQLPEDTVPALQPLTRWKRGGEASRGRFSDVSHCRISVLSLLGPCGSSILATGHWVHSFVRRGHHLGCRMQWSGSIAVAPTRLAQEDRVDLSAQIQRCDPPHLDSHRGSPSLHSDQVVPR